VLLHVTSLPTPYGVGDFGPKAREFIEFLAEAGACYWQVLPLVPTSPPSFSPYSSESTFALNPIFVSLDDIAGLGLISRSFVEESRVEPSMRADYMYAYRVKRAALHKAFEAYKSREKWLRRAIEDFFGEHEYWLRDYALFRILRELYGSPWSRWPREYRLRSPSALKRVWEEYSDRIEYIVFEQFLLWRQWKALRKKAREAGISIIGDVPYYVSYDSADVWTNQHLFKLDNNGEPLYVGGVPPGKFSATGQLWGMPVYNWEAHKNEEFQWWIKRLSWSLELYDIVRLDHFRGFIAYWEIPAGSPTAARGKWVPTPYKEFFRVLARSFPSMPFIAEDLGLITPDVREVMKRYMLPGMRVLVFAFSGSPHNEHLPHNYEDNMVVYTSTHDTNTVKGWYTDEASSSEKEFLRRYVGSRVDHASISWVFINIAMASIARLAIIPAQDILGLGSEARMNKPGTSTGNWLWRLLPGQLTSRHASSLREVAETYGRV
jgi:4-alpha-glucanotransferase